MGFQKKADTIGSASTVTKPVKQKVAVSKPQKSLDGKNTQENQAQVVQRKVKPAVEPAVEPAEIQEDIQEDIENKDIKQETTITEYFEDAKLSVTTKSKALGKVDTNPPRQEKPIVLVKERQVYPSQLVSQLSEKDLEEFNERLHMIGTTVQKLLATSKKVDAQLLDIKANKSTDVSVLADKVGQIGKLKYDMGYCTGLIFGYIAALITKDTSLSDIEAAVSAEFGTALEESRLYIGRFYTDRGLSNPYK